MEITGTGEGEERKAVSIEKTRLTREGERRRDAKESRPLVEE